MNFYLQHGYGTNGPFRTESVEVRESWTRQKPRGNVRACRFMVLHASRWRRLYSDYTPGLPMPHFIVVDGERVTVTGVCP